MNLGNDEILECFIGADPIIEAYLGEDLVFSTGPFAGLKLTPKNIELKSAKTSVGSTFSIFVKSSEDWTLTTDSDWFSLSPTTGLGTSEKTEVTLTVTSIPTAETLSTISATTANFSASTSVLFKLGYGIPDNEIWYTTFNEQPITSLNRWSVYDDNKVKMTPNFSTYGKFVFPRKVAYVAGDLNQTNNNWVNLVDLGLPEMTPSLCIGSNDFGMRYMNANMNYFTRVYGDYQYIDDDEVMAWASDGCGVIVARGKTGELVVPEGVKAIPYYGLSRVKFSSIVFPLSLTGVSEYNNGLALADYACEDASQLTSIKYQTMQAPSIGNNAFNRVNTTGVVYYPAGGTGYANIPKPTNFTLQSY